jgi:hypothetical protein
MKDKEECMPIVLTEGTEACKDRRPVNQRQEGCEAASFFIVYPSSFLLLTACH